MFPFKTALLCVHLCGAIGPGTDADVKVCFLAQHPHPLKPELGPRWVFPYTKDILCTCTVVRFGGLSFQSLPGAEDFFYPEGDPLSFINVDSIEDLRNKLQCFAVEDSEGKYHLTSYS